MFWTLLGFLIVGFFALYAYLAKRRDRSRDRGYYSSKTDWPVVWGLFIFFMVLWLIPAIIVAAVYHATALNADESATVIAVKVEQRDALAAQVKDMLSPEEFAAMMAATPDVDLLVLFGSGASDVLIERARQIVALNQSVNDLELSVVKRRAEVCAAVRNPFLPALPGTLPECERS